MDQAIAAIRSFNRFYTRLAGVLDARFLGTDTTLVEARLLFEIAHRDAPVAAELQTALGLDGGYASRLLQRLAARGWLARTRASTDARRRTLRLTPEGHAVLATIDTRQHGRAAGLLASLEAVQRADLVAALGLARILLEPPPALTIALRPFRTGDLPLIAARQALLYAQENDWGVPLEANVMETASRFLRGFKPGREQCWVAELDGVLAGSVMLTDEGDGLARLRLLYVEPFARGHGLGTTLVATCLGFAREVGYGAMTLWTHNVLAGARRIYAAQGFVLVESAVHLEFGVPALGETWRKEGLLF